VDLKLKTNKPILVVGSGFSEKVNTEDFFVLCSGKCLYSLDYADVVVSLDLIRIIHNISNFRKKWGIHLVPHRITNEQWFGSSSGIMQRRSGEVVYLKSPVHSLMFWRPDEFIHLNKPKGHFDNLSICCDSLSYEEANETINFSKFRVKKFLREDTTSYNDFAIKDGVLRNNSSSIHLILNLLWLNKVEKIYTLGVTEDHYSWDTTKRLMDMYNINYERL